MSFYARNQGKFSARGTPNEGGFPAAAFRQGLSSSLGKAPLNSPSMHSSHKRSFLAPQSHPRPRISLSLSIHLCQPTHPSSSHQFVHFQTHTSPSYSHPFFSCVHIVLSFVTYERSKKIMSVRKHPLGSFLVIKLLTKLTFDYKKSWVIFFTPNHSPQSSFFSKTPQNLRRQKTSQDLAPTLRGAFWCGNWQVEGPSGRLNRRLRSPWTIRSLRKPRWG